MNQSAVEAYPLSWPMGIARQKGSVHSRFRTTFGKARDELVSELKRMNAKNPIISTNIPLRNDGLPYANFKTPDDKGVAVYFMYKGKQMVFACDKFNKIEDNLFSICKTINAIRSIERWGSSDMLERAFSGFAQLEAPITAESPWYDVLGLSLGAVERLSDDERQKLVKSQYHALVKEHHPDVGGDPTKFQQIQNAYEQGMSSLY